MRSVYIPYIYPMNIATPVLAAKLREMDLFRSIEAPILMELAEKSGIIRVGAEVKSGDVLVGKITPKGESDLTGEEKLIVLEIGEIEKELDEDQVGYCESA